MNFILILILNILYILSNDLINNQSSNEISISTTTATDASNSTANLADASTISTNTTEPVHIPSEYELAQYENALNLYYYQNYNVSLEIIKSNLLLSPKNLTYLTLLGDVQVKLENFEEAKVAYDTALSFDYGISAEWGTRTKLRNLRYLKPDIFKPIPKPPPFINNNTNIRKPLPRIECDSLYDPLNEQYMLGKLPYILVGCTDYFDIANFSIEDLYKYSFVSSDYNPENCQFANNTKTYNIPLGEGLDEFISPSKNYGSNPELPGAYLIWTLNRKHWKTSVRKHLLKLPKHLEYDDNWLNGCLSPEASDEYVKTVNWRMYLIGSEGAGLFNHIDTIPSASWQGHLLGSKLWHICAPSEDKYILKNISDVISADENNVFNPDYVNFPDFAKADCYEDTLYPGEFLYYPKKYWHQTRNMETPTVSITGTIVDHNNYKDVIEYFKEYCKDDSSNLGEGICAEMPKCYDYWRNDFGEKKVITAFADILPFEIADLDKLF